MADAALIRSKPRKARRAIPRRTADGAFVTYVSLLLAFLYTPVAILIVFSFNESRVLAWPLSGFTLDWYRAVFANDDLLEAVGNSFYVATLSTSLALCVGVPAAMALHRFAFPGKALFRRLLLLPIALPGIVTGISMLNFFNLMGFDLSLQTVVLGHATALLAVVVTQVFARLGRLPPSLEEASSDLGAGPLVTFWFVTLPNIKTAIVGSGLLVFVLSFDEIPVTFFLTGRDNTLPMYIYSTMRRGVTPEINAVGTLLIVFSAVLIVLAALLTRAPGRRR